MGFTSLYNGAKPETLYIYTIKNEETESRQIWHVDREQQSGVRRNHLVKKLCLV